MDWVILVENKSTRSGDCKNVVSSILSETKFSIGIEGEYTKEIKVVTSL